MAVVNNLVDAPIAPVVAVLAGVVTLVLVVPIDDVNRAVLVIELVERLRPGVVEVQEILPMMAHVTRALALRDVHV